MLKRFLPKQEDFFQLFKQTADLLVAATSRFHEMLCQLDKQQQFVDAIAGYEQSADRITHHTFNLLHKTFITPFDRYDIHTLTSGLDDILDRVNRCAQRFPFYALTEVPTEMIRLAELAKHAGENLKNAVGELHLLKKSVEILKHCKAIDRIESEAHQVVLAGEKNLFEQEQDFKQFFKLKEIYAQTKLVINQCQDVANLIKGIVLEYA